jgi:hypothetical protein
MTLYDDPLVRKYLLVKLGIAPTEAASPLVGIYGELYEAPPPEGAADAAAAAAKPAIKASDSASTVASATASSAAAVAAPAAADATSTTTPTSAAVTATSTATAAAPQRLTAQQLEMEKVVLECWESLEPASLGHLQYLVKQGQSVNAGLSMEPVGMTALMAVAGNVANGGAEVAELLALGADPFQPDAEGHTALHWAALNGRAAAVEAIAAAFSQQGFQLKEGPVRLGPGSALSAAHTQRTLKAGLAAACHKGRTALQTAQALRSRLLDVEAASSSSSSSSSATAKKLSAAEQSTLRDLPAVIAALEKAEREASA